MTTQILKEKCIELTNRCELFDKKCNATKNKAVIHLRNKFDAYINKTVCSSFYLQLSERCQLLHHGNLMAMKIAFIAGYGIIDKVTQEDFTDSGTSSKELYEFYHDALALHMTIGHYWWAKETVSVEFADNLVNTVHGPIRSLLRSFLYVPFLSIPLTTLLDSSHHLMHLVVSGIKYLFDVKYKYAFVYEFFHWKSVIGVLMAGFNSDEDTDFDNLVGSLNDCFLAEDAALLSHVFSKDCHRGCRSVPDTEGSGDDTNSEDDSEDACISEEVESESKYNSADEHDCDSECDADNEGYSSCNDSY
jgi:hypothetical protein